MRWGRRPLSPRSSLGARSPVEDHHASSLRNHHQEPEVGPAMTGAVATGAQANPTITVRRAEDRTATELSWLDSKHSFSFGVDNDRDNLHHGLLLVNNDDTVRADAGFGTHPHRAMEIVTWVLTGSLVPQNSQVQ